MTMDELRNILMDALCQATDIQREEVQDDTDLTLLGIDSIGLLTAVCMAENALGVELQENDLFRVVTFGELVDYVRARIGL